MKFEPFCHNKKCHFNKHNAFNSHWIEVEHWISVEVLGGKMIVRRHEYVSCMSNKNYYLCDVCHEAVQMTIKERGSN